MKAPFSGAIDCDIHPSPPDMRALLPYMSEYWRDQITNRFIHKTPFILTSHKPGVPINGRPDWRPASGLPGSSLDMIRKPGARCLRRAVCDLQRHSRRDRAFQS